MRDEVLAEGKEVVRVIIPAIVRVLWLAVRR